MMQAPAQSSQLLPGPFVFSRLCSALTLAGLAFYACAPERDRARAGSAACAEANYMQLVLLFATAIAICIA